MIYDIIGDIHGHADKLKGLLDKLGYQLTMHDALGCNYYHPPANHRALFIGDLIDRGNQELETLQITFNMIDAGVADCLLGNHEYNALAFATPNNLSAGNHNEHSQYLRSHNKAHTRQHQAFLDEIPFGSQAHQYWLNRFYELPLWIETDHACFVHACWDADNMAVLKPYLTHNNCLTHQALQVTGQKGTKEYDALERVLKGVEAPLPSDISFKDKDGTVRRNVRVKWWLNNLDGRPIVTIARATKDDLAQIPPDAIYKQVDFKLKTDKPIFIGHYWMTGEPMPLSHQVVCTDYSAGGKGFLTAYQFDTENPLPLSKDNFVQHI